MKEAEESGERKNIQSAAKQRVKQRMRWEPFHPLEREIYQVAIQRAEDLLMGEEEE